MSHTVLDVSIQFLLPLRTVPDQRHLQYMLSCYIADCIEIDCLNISWTVGISFAGVLIVGRYPIASDVHELCSLVNMLNPDQ